MDPNAALHALRAEVATHLEHGDGDIDVLVEHVNALDEWLSRGGFRPDAWQTRRRMNDQLLVGPEAEAYKHTRRRPVRRDDATHPSELPNPADEQAFFDGAQRRAAAPVVEAIQRELDAHLTWRPGQPIPSCEPVTYLQVNGERVPVPLSALDQTNPDGVTVWERGLGGESPYYYPPGMTPDSWREAHAKTNQCDPCGAVDRDDRSAEPSTYEDPAVQRAIAETIARGDV